MRRVIGTNLPIEKDLGTQSDIDYIIPPSSFSYWEPYINELPGMDVHGPIPGIPNPYIGDTITFEPR